MIKTELIMVTEKEGEYARDNFENCWKQYHNRI